MTDSQFGPNGEAQGGGADSAPSPEAVQDMEAADARAEEAEALVDEHEGGVHQDPRDARLAELESLVAERTLDLQRVHAEYVNYKKRVDRDRDLARQAGIEVVVGDLMPVLDHIELAKQHETLEGGFKMIADELQKVAAKHGLVAFGDVGEEFDPTRHEALMSAPLDQPVEVVTVSQVMQQGYSLHGRVIRPARVAVAHP
ncbi:Protein GrpE [Tessaracoccus sp. O5.2]|nr:MULTISPECIES: nucleotide exchange factor GrpE [Tessaracoccus]VEP39878.1 Protein GrpE [Tessaracoccus lapidicaptus]